MKRRVVVSGLGVVSPIGNDVETFWKSILDQKCGIDEITLFDTSNHKVKIAAEVKDLDFESYFSKRDLKFNDRFIQFARIAAKQAYQDANFKSLDVNRFGVILSSGIGGVETIAHGADVIAEKGPGRVSPFFIPMSLVNLAAGNVAIDLNAQGYCSSVVTACAAATNSIGEAFHKIRDGYLDVVVAGGSEAAITPLAIAGFTNMKALSESNDKNRASIPFDKERNGFVMGEGAGVLILEELEHALKRNAKIYGEIVGYGNSCDAYHITSPSVDGSGAAKAIQNAISDANIQKEDLVYINAHGTSTPMNDRIETSAVKLALQQHAHHIYMSSTKSYTGHLLGASGAVEAIATVLSTKYDYIPATIHYQEYDAECDLNIVANNPVSTKVTYAMSNSFGFGGHNASIIFKKWED